MFRALDCSSVVEYRSIMSIKQNTRIEENISSTVLRIFRLMNIVDNGTIYRGIAVFRDEINLYFCCD